MPPDKQTDVAKRIAQMDRTSPDVIKEVEKVLEQKLSSLVNQDYTVVGGVDAIVEILNTVDRGTEKHIMESMEIEDPELADEIRKKMFVFEDICSLDDRSVQRVLREVDNNELAIALKGSNEESTEPYLQQSFQTSCQHDQRRHGVYGTCAYERC